MFKDFYNHNWGTLCLKKTLSLFFVALLSAAFQAKGITYGQLANNSCFGVKNNLYYSTLIFLGIVDTEGKTTLNDCGITLQRGFKGCYNVIEDSSLMGGNLEEADLRSTLFFNVNLVCANLKESNLNRSYLNDINLQRSCLDNSSAQDAYLVRACLSYASLKRTDLSGSFLQSANLMRADLRRANLTNASLAGTYLKYADLRKAVFTDAETSKETNVDGACIVGAIGFDEAFKDAVGTPLRTFAACKDAGFYVSREDLAEEEAKQATAIKS